jgi:hypothetical protein
MFAPGDREFAGNAVAYRGGFGSPEVTALTSALSSLVAASDGVADAVTRHDRLALVRSNEQADALVDEVNRLAAALTDEDRMMLGEFGVPGLCARLADGARRNAYLIEQAWAVDAALMRLLLGLGRVGADGTVGGYSVPPGPTYVDRGA